jgi:hypothetical protein
VAPTLRAVLRYVLLAFWAAALRAEDLVMVLPLGVTQALLARLEGRADTFTLVRPALAAVD